MTNRNI